MGKGASKMGVDPPGVDTERERSRLRPHEVGVGVGLPGLLSRRR